MLKRIGAEESGEFKAIASGTLPSGRPVIVNADGTVSVVSGTSRSQVLGTETVFESANSKDFAAAYDTTNDKVLIAYRDIGNFQRGTAIVGTVSGSTISFGSAAVFESGATTYISVAFDSTAGKFLIAYRDEGDSNQGKAVVATISGTSVSFGSVTQFESGNTPYSSTVYDSSNGKMVISYADFGNSSYGTSVVGTISGTSVSFGTPVVFESAATGWVNSVYDSNAQKVFIGYQDGGNSDYPTGIVGTVSGTSISFGSATAVASNGSNYTRVGFDSTNNKVLIAYRNEGDSGKGYAAVGTISGTSVSFGTSVNFSGSEAVIMESPNVISFDTTSGGMLIAYEDTTRDATVIRGVISGTSISFDTAVVLDTGGGSSHEYLGIVYDPDQDRHVVFYKDGAESNYGTAIVYSPAYTSSNLTSENYIGMSRGVAFQTGSAASAGSTVTFLASNCFMRKDGSVYDSSNNKVIIGYKDNSNSQYGTAIVGTVDNSDNSITFGSAVVFESAITDHITATFDSNSNKVVFAYRDEGNSNAGTAVVGTVSGTSISFGTPVVFESGSTLGIGMTFDTNSNKVVISYSDQTGGQDGTAVVGTVSGTSISFGSPVKFEVGNVDYTSATFDSSNNKVVISFSDNDNSNYGTAIVGTVSGTSISFGSAVVFASEYTVFNPIVFDSSNNKVVVSYRAGTDGDKGKSVVGTVSGTSISFGSVATFNDAAMSEMSAVFDTSLNQVVIAYRDDGNSNQGTAIAGTVSGTSISFGSELIYQTGAVADNTLVYDTNANRFVVFYRDNGSPYAGKANVFNTSTLATTRGEVASGNQASMDIIGSVSTNQLSLTAGQQYYVQTDGTIGTTADSPSVLAGTAISATELLVKT